MIIIGFSGAAKATQIVPIPNLKSEEKEGEKKDQWIVSVALDRFLRVHELKTRLKAMEHKIYLKQRLTAILVDTDYVIDTIQKQEDDEAEELWNNLDTITEKKDDKKKKARLA